MQTGQLERVPPGIEVQSSDPPQDKQKTEERLFGHVNPELLLVPGPDPIQYVERSEFRKEWEVHPFQFAPTISAVPPTSQEKVNSQAITRGQKRKQEEEGFVGEGSEFEGSGIKDKGKRKVDEGQKQGRKVDMEKEQEEETDADDEYDPHVDNDTVNEPNFIWNENKETSWGKCDFKAVEDDKTFGNGKVIRHPFYRNIDGFILKRYPSEGQHRVYIPDGRCKIGGEFYPMRRLLIHSAHHRLTHYGVSKTYRNISKDTIWPG